MFRRTPVITRLERQHERDQAQWRDMICAENELQAEAVHLHGTAFWSGTQQDLAAETKAWAALDAMREERRALAARLQERDARALAHLGRRGGTLHQLLDEYDREELRGEHAYTNGWREGTLTEGRLDKYWDAIRKEHRDLTHGDTTKSADQIMRAIGARPGNARTREWVEDHLQTDRATEAEMEREREEWFADQALEEHVTDYGTGPEGDEPAAQERAAAPDAEAEL